PMPLTLPRRFGAGHWAVLALLAAALLGRSTSADPPDRKAPSPPAAPAPAPKQLSEADAKWVGAQSKTIDALGRAGKFAEAVAPARQVVEVYEKALGPDHWQTADARRLVETLKTIDTLPEEGRRALAARKALYEAFLDADGKARYEDAERLG